MPRNGSGVYTAPQNSWNPAVNGAGAQPADWMAILQDLVTAMTQSTSADGQTLITGVWNFGNNRITGVGAPVGTGNALRWEQMIKGPDIASAATIDIPVEGSLFDVTGTTTITTINDRFPGRIAFLRFEDVVELAHSTSLVLPSGVNAKTSDGDVLCVMNTASGVWEVVSWPRLAAANFPSVTEPTITWPFMPWADTASGLLKRRSADNSTWTVEGKLFDYHYSRSSVVGLVSQTGGVPTGAVIQSGGDSVNSYVRLADGTQICRRRFTITSEIQIPWGNIFESVEFGLGNYAIPFIAPPAVGVSCEGAPSWSGVATPGTASIWPTMKLFRATASGSGLSLTLCGIAVGRWF